jgi:hypothetical protein
MKGMYNTNALEGFTNAVEGIRADQRAQDENRMRMRALDSQLATEKAERDLLPARLALDSKKLEYEMTIGKMDMLLKTASTVDVLQTNSLDRTIKTDQHGEWKDVTPLRKGMMNLEYQMASMNAFARTVEIGHQFRQWAQQDLYGPLYAMATFLTSIAPNLVQAANVIEKGDKEVKSRMGFVTERLVDKSKKDKNGDYLEFNGDNRGVIEWSNMATGRSGMRNPDDAVSGLAYSIAQDYGDRYRVVDKNGKAQYQPPTDGVDAGQGLQGARDNLYARHLIESVRGLDNALPGVQETQRAYTETAAGVEATIDELAATAKDPKLKREIMSKIDLLLYNSQESAQEELKSYLMEKGGTGLVIQVMGNDSVEGLRHHGYTLSGFARIQDGIPVFDNEQSDWRTGKTFVTARASKIWPNEMLSPDDFNSVLAAKANRDGTMKLLGETEDMLGLGANAAGDVFRRAMTTDLLKGIVESGGGTEDGTMPRNSWSMIRELGEETNKRLENYGLSIGAIDSVTAAAGYGSAYRGQ